MADEQSGRRRFLRLGATGVAVGLGGCRALGFGGGGSSVPSASFAFEYDRRGGQSGGSLRVTHDGGDGVRAGRLSLRSSAGHEALWSKLRSTDVAATGAVTSGDTARLDATVVNWPADVGLDERIKVVYDYEETTSTLDQFVPDVTPTPTPTATPTPTPAPERFVGDDFEDADGLDAYRIDRGDSREYDWGIASGEAPDGGTRYVFLSEGSGGKGTRTIVMSDASVAWNRSYRFDFLLRCSDWPADTPYNEGYVGWRGDGINGSDWVKFQTFNTDGAGSDRTIRFTGAGTVANEREQHVDWREAVWYRVCGEVRENPDEETATARAKVWRAEETEPDGFPVRASLRNGVSRPLSYEFLANGRGAATVTLDVAHAVWTPL